MKKKATSERAERALRRALDKTEEAIADMRAIDTIDADTFDLIRRDLRNALRFMKGATSYHPPSFNENADKLKEFFDGMDEKTSRTEEVSLRLTEMAGWMINNTPEGGQLARAIYFAIGEAWDAARRRYGLNSVSEPTERQIVALHRELLDELSDERKPKNLKAKQQADSHQPREAKRNDNSSRLKELRDRLESLNEYGDITDCTQRFQLETEIYKLEHEAPDDGADFFDRHDII